MHDCFLRNRNWKRISRYVIAIAIAVLSIDGRQANSHEVRGQHESEATEPDQVELRWHFEPGDLFHWQITVYETITDDQGKQHKNERVYDYTWFVESVDSFGDAIIEVTFDRIQHRGQWPDFEFDTREDDPFTTLAGDSDAIELIYRLRATKASQMTFSVTSRGGAASELVGGECVPGPAIYTPMDLPALPESEVRVGEAWAMKTELKANDSEIRGQAEYRVTRTAQVNGYLMCYLEGANKTASSLGVLEPLSNLQVTSTSCFNAGLGQFESESTQSEFRVEYGTDQIASVRVNSERRLLRRTKRDETPEESGLFLFGLHGESPKPLIMNGVSVAKPSDLSGVVDKVLLLEFFHRWLDKNQDGTPGPGELSGMNTRFAADERVQFIVDTKGLKNEELFFILISGGGKPLFRNDIAIKGNDWFATRKLPQLEPGIYFFEFALNDRFLVRLPVQVHRKLD